MPRDADTHTTTHAGLAPGLALLPSVFEIGRALRALDDAYHGADVRMLNLEKHSAPHQAAERARNLAGDRRDALAELVLSTPARTLDDAVVQLCLSLDIMDRLDGCKQSDYDRNDDVLRLRRIVGSVLPVIAREVGLDLAEIGGEHVPEFCVREFPDVLVQVEV